MQLKEIDLWLDETYFDKKSNVVEGIVYDVPNVPRWCDQLPNIKKEYIDIDDCKLYVEQVGDGQPIVCLHGGPGASHHYFHPSFSSQQQLANFILYDQRGCGLSDYNPSTGYSFEQAIKDLEKLRKKLNIEKWFVLGHSYGGYLGQCYTIKYPERVKGLILVCASPPPDVVEKLDEKNHLDYVLEEEKSKLNEIRAEYKTGKLSITQLVFNLQLNGDWKRQNYYRPTKERIAQVALYEWSHDKNFNQTMYQSYSKYDFHSDYLNKLGIPILLIEGKNDLTWTPNKAALFHQAYPKSILKIFDKSSHNPFTDEPEKFSKVTNEFITSKTE